MMSMRQAGAHTGVHKETISRWVKDGRLKRVERRMVGHVQAIFVDVAEVKREGAKITTGRPRKVGGET